MLKDSDRIFKNLYGFHDWRLKAARARLATSTGRAPRFPTFSAKAAPIQ